MGKKVRSARGIEVDFDLLKIKQQIAESPTVNVANREAFVEKRLRRRPKRSVVPVAAIKVAELEVELPEPELEEELLAPEVTDEPVVRPVRKAK